VNPLVSILVRSMDRPSLRRALDSIAAQDYPAIEVVVVAASGATHATLPATCGGFPLRFLAQERALQRAEAANAALDAARGDWLNFLDDDDELLPTHVTTLRSALDADPSRRLAHSVSEDRGADGSLAGYHGGRFKPWRQLDTGFFRPHCAMFSRSLVAEGARFDAHFEILEDMDFFIQCAQRTNFIFVENPTTRYYADAGNSGAGTGGNRDEPRLRGAIASLRSKWTSLEAALRATPEFRGEQALWLIEQGAVDAAAPIVSTLLAEGPESPDAQTLDALLHVIRGDVGGAQAVVAGIGERTPALEALALRLDQLRSRMSPTH
jgi:hypothetical protein